MLYIVYILHIVIYTAYNVNSETTPLRSQPPQHANTPHQTKSKKCSVTLTLR